MDWYIGVLKKYAEFKGRARRKELWMFVLFNFIISIALGLIDYMLGMQLIGSLYSLAILIPSLAVGARRLHDIGKSGWWQLLYFLPILGFLILLYFFVLDSKPGTNDYGDNPKGA
jgi:uncharacterized membrane protein YhaH (DUF805 family)